MKHIKQYNESIKDFLKPKTEEDIESKLQNLSLIDKINTILRYKLYSDDKIKNILNSLPNDELKNVLRNQSYIRTNNLYNFISLDRLKELYPIVTQSHELIQNLPIWKAKILRDYQAMQFVSESSLSKITYDMSVAYFIIILSNYTTKEKTTIKIQEDSSGNHIIIRNLFFKYSDTIDFQNVEEIFDILSTNKNIPEPLRKYFKMEYTVPKTNIKRIEDYMIRKRKELEDFERNETNESIKDILKPKSKEEILKIIENKYPTEKLKYIIKYNIINYFTVDEIKSIFEKCNIDDKKEFLMDFLSKYHFTKEWQGRVLRINDVHFKMTESDMINFFNEIILPNIFKKNKMNESIKDSLKPKQTYDILKKLENIPDDKKLDTILKYNLMDTLPNIDMEYVDNLINTSSPQQQLYIGCRYGIPELVENSLENGADPSLDLTNTIVCASHKGYTDIVKMLLKDKRTYPSYNNNHAFEMACIMGRYDIVKLLLNDDRFDLYNLSTIIFRLCLKYKHYNILKYLINNDKIRNRFSLELINKYEKELKEYEKNK